MTQHAYHAAVSLTRNAVQIQILLIAAIMIKLAVKELAAMMVKLAVKGAAAGQMSAVTGLRHLRAEIVARHLQLEIANHTLVNVLVTL